MRASVEPTFEQSVPPIAVVLDRLHPAWHGEALCRGRGELFYPDPGGSYAEASALCATCPVS